MIQVKTIIFFLFLSCFLSAQTSTTVQKTFAWEKDSFVVDRITQKVEYRPSYQQAVFDENNMIVPIQHLRIPVNSYGKFKVSISRVEFMKSDFEISPSIIQYLNNQLEFHTSVQKEKQNYIGFISFAPLLYRNQAIELVKNIELRIDFSPEFSSISKNPPTTESILNQGDFVQFKISSTGIHSLTGSALATAMNTSVESIDVDKIQIFSNAGGPVPNANMDDRYDDLQELPLHIKGGNNGVFGSSDQILFYAEGATVWAYDNETDYYNFKDNPFDTDNYIYVRINQGTGKRVQDLINFQSDQPIQNEYLKLSRLDEDKYNLLDESFGNEGSGQLWFGDIFSNAVPSRDYTSKLDLPNLLVGKDVFTRMQFAGRSGGTSNVTLSIGALDYSKSMSSVSLTNQEGTYAKIAKITEIYTAIENKPSIVINFPSSSSTTKGWLDYIEFQYPQNLNYTSSPIDIRTQVPASTTRNLQIASSKSLKLWDVSDFTSVKGHKINFSNGIAEFTITDLGGSHYIAFDENGSFLVPELVGSIENQNLHAISKADLLIISHSTLWSQAERLAEFRRDFNDYTVQVVDVEKIYHEFSSGRCDPSAIRDFIKMVYDRDLDLKYVLFMGRGSFDYRGIKYDREKYNLVPVYETETSLYPIESFPSDDYYTLLSEQEGGNLKGQLDIAIGRIPVDNIAHAKTVVDKIIRYETSAELRGDWNLRSVWVADDEDVNTHINQSNSIAVNTNSNYPVYNQEKIFFDAFIQESTPGGERYPDVTSEINNKIFKGALTLCYLGHGGPSGWAQERVLQVSDIDAWSNTKSLPLFITATCSFATYDDPSVFSAGEKVLVNEYGGIALFTTTRAVFSNDNRRLTQAVFDTIYTKENNKHLGIGEILRRAKNTNSDDTTRTNARKFILLGDPALRLLIPEQEVYTTHINGQDIQGIPLQDTIQALSKMSIKGYVGNNGEKNNGYNGIISVTVFDKEIQSKTLGQDNGSFERNFQQRKNIIFKGKAEVKNGDFDLEFIVPKDILFEYGTGKISYYATNGSSDAMGYFTEFIVGGSDTTSIMDDTPPLVQVFMNNEDFVSGGLTSPDPKLFVKISDDNGINLSGTSVGHDLTGILDNNAQKTYVLNDFYESELNDFKNGSILYPLSKLENGKHEIVVEAWDVANNVGEGYVEFYVSDDPGKSLEHVLNYPNPFTTSTCFQFEHNISGDMLDIQVDIFTISGKLVKTILHSSYADGFRVNDIKWDGNDDFGSKIGKGVYLYKIKVKAQQQDIHKESNFEKLVILK